MLTATTLLGRGLVGLRAAAIAAALLLPLPSGAEPTSFAAIEKVLVAPVDRTKTNQLIDGGTIATDGFAQVTLSFAGEFKEGIPQSGTLGAILIPDREPFLYLFRTENRPVYALEVKLDVRGLKDAIFASPQEEARIAFPAYRVFFYNETSSSAAVWLFAHRTR